MENRPVRLRRWTDAVQQSRLGAVKTDQAIGVRLAWSFEWLGTPVVGYAMYLALVAGFLWLLWRRPARLAPILLIVAVFPLFYFISPYTWLQSEPRYLTLVVPLFANARKSSPLM